MVPLLTEFINGSLDSDIMVMWQDGAKGKRKVKVLIVKVSFLQLIWNCCEVYLYMFLNDNIDVVLEFFSTFK